MYIYRRRDSTGLDGAAWEPPPARAEDDAASEHGRLAKTLVGILIVLLVAVLVAVIALAL